jgi:hypothetical protein
MSRIDLIAARREATFVALLEGRTVTLPTLPALIRSTIGRYGTRGCAAIVATEYGDHPEVAVYRMGRARALVAAGYPVPDRNRTSPAPQGPDDHPAAAGAAA